MRAAIDLQKYIYAFQIGQMENCDWLEFDFESLIDGKLITKTKTDTHAFTVMQECTRFILMIIIYSEK